jgi:menaquinone-dependent protoporphyrinogen oxidase
VKILVSTASKHGSTSEIADRIAETLRVSIPGVTVDVVPAAAVGGVDQYHALVVGSAVYMGRWLEDARRLADRIAALAPRPVWLFSSGPIGDPPKPDEEPAEVADMIKTTNANGHRRFAGRLDRHRLGFGEKAVIMALQVPDGDLRDWDAIHAWGGQIAEELNRSAGMPGLPVTRP